MDAKQIFQTYEPIAATKDRLGKFCSECGAQFPDEQLTKEFRHCPNCGARQFANPTPAVSVLVRKNDQVLLCRRTSTSLGTGQWCLPAGFIEFDEDFLSAARREVAEETGLIIEVDKVISVVSNFFNPKIHSLVVVLLANVIGGDMQAGDDADAVDWFDPSDLPDLAFEADEHIIERYFGNTELGVPVQPS